METFLIVSSVLLWLAVLFNLLLTLALVRRINTTVPRSEGLKVGQQAPDFTAQTLNSETVTFSHYTDRPVIFLFVSTHCAPCRELIPSIEALEPQVTQTGAQLVLVSGDGLQDTRDLADELHIHLPILVAPRDSNHFFKDYNISSTPSYCFINEQGKVQEADYPDLQFGIWKAFADSRTRNEDSMISERR